MSKKAEDEARAILEAAISAAINAGITNLNEKIQAAINLGIEIGAATGAEIGAAAAAKAADREHKKAKQQRHDNRLHNTKLLIRNYRRLNDYYQNAVYDTVGAEDAGEDFKEIMQSFGVEPDSEKLEAGSIKRNYLITRVVMSHVNVMLEVYRNECQSSQKEEDQRRWRVLNRLYLSEERATAEDLAQQERIDKRTVYKDIDACVKDLAVLFFGLSGLGNI